MTTYLPLTNFPDYSVKPSKQMVDIVSNQGLIEPLIAIDTFNIHPISQERFMAFRQLAKSYGAEGSSDVIVVFLSEMSKEEKKECQL